MSEPVEFLSPLAPYSAPQLEPGPRRGPNLPNGPLKSPGAQRLGVQVPDAVRAFVPHQYARITDIPGAVLPVSTGPAVEIVQESTTFRNYLAIRNPQASGGVDVLVGFGAAPVPAATHRITPGQTLIWDTVVPQDAVYVLSSGAAGTVSVAYSNMPAFP